MDHRVLIGICTYNRPNLLHRLLSDLHTQATGGWDARVIVVDNSPDASAVTVVHSFDALLGKTPLYVHEPSPGLVRARNRALAERDAGEALIFIDDDEWPSPDWLETLLMQAIESPGWILAGPVIRCHVDDGARQQLGPMTRERKVGEEVETCGFGNVLLPASLLDSRNLTLDARYNLSGGEDTDFCLRARRHGTYIRWVPDAVCYEEHPQARTSFGFVAKQALVQAAIYSDVQRRVNRRVAVRIIRMLGRMVRGLADVMRGLLGLRKPSIRQGAVDMAGGAGGLMGIFGVLPKRYGARPSRSRPRSDPPATL